jgi:hypothetical protein
MKKVILIIAMFFASFSSSVALAGSQSYTSPWRPPSFEEGGDNMYVNVNSYSNLQLSGTFYPSVSYPETYTYCDFSFYSYSATPSNSGHIYGYIYGKYTENDPYFSYTTPNYQHWDTIFANMNVSNGYATMTVSWY